MKTFILTFILLANTLFAFENLNEENFDSKTKKGNIIVNFHAPWCSVCQEANKNLKEFSKNTNQNIKIYKVDISEEIQLTKTFNADMVPVFVYIKDGKIVSQESGIKDVNRIKDCSKAYFK